MSNKKQASLSSFFAPAKAEEKENSTMSNKAEEASTEQPTKEPPVEQSDSDDEEEVVAKRPSPVGDAKKKPKRRKVIDDDEPGADTMEEDNETPSVEKATAEKPTGSEKKVDATTKTTAKPSSNSNGKPMSKASADFFAPKSPKKKAASSSKKTSSTEAKKKQTANDSSTKPAASKPTESTTTKPAADKSIDTGNAKAAASEILKLSKDVPSNAAVLKEMDESWGWEEGAAVPYVVLCQAFSKIEATTKRLEIQKILTTLFRQILLQSSDLYSVLYLASNSVAPAYDCVELGIGDSILLKAIGETTGISAANVKTKYDKEGDLGTVAMSCKGKQKTLGGFFQTAVKKTGLTVSHVLQVFREIAETKGNQSQKFKVDKIKKLLVESTNKIEVKYIIRGLQGKLRIGLAQSTVLISLAHALAYTIPKTVVALEDSAESMADDEEPASVPEEVAQYTNRNLPVEKRLEGAVGIVKKAYSEVPSYDAILDAALKAPLQDLGKLCTLRPGIPVSPMLAKPTKSVAEVLKRLNGLKFTCEYKYDGERAQVHLLPNGTHKVFSRNLLDTTEKYPEVPLFVKEAGKDVESFVLDAEVVAFNNKTGQLVPFQVLSTRKKTEESAQTAKVQVIVQAFDLMYLNGESLLNRTLFERRELMHKHFKAVPGKFQFATAIDHQENGDTTVIEEFLDAAVKGQCEGLMVKTLDVNAIYEPSRRSLNWLKLKKDYLEGLGDSFDLVPLGAYHGKGKRTGVYGAYLLACYDADTEEFQSVCKIGTGFSEEDLKMLGEGLSKHIIPQKSSQYQVTDQLECDVWFDAVQVWEVKAADLSKSSAHRGAVGKTGEEGRGIGLRFPRFERLRDDKTPEEATTSDQVLDMYYAQDTIVAEENDDDDDEGI